MNPTTQLLPHQEHDQALEKFEAQVVYHMEMEGDLENSDAQGIVDINQRDFYNCFYQKISPIEAARHLLIISVVKS